MRILLTNAWLEYFLGSEKWAYTMAQELLHRKHDVDFATYLDGKMYDKMAELPGISMVDPLEIDDGYDLAIVNHNAILPQIPDKIFTIFTSHGPSAEPEQPIPGADVYVAVSEEVQDNLASKGFPSTVIRNPVDLDRYSARSEIRKEPKKALYITNHFGAQSQKYQIAKEACETKGIDIIPIGLQFGNSMWEVEDAIDLVDIVFTLGRGVLEAMASERNVIVADWNGIDGYVDDETYYQFRERNFSGRTNKLAFTKENIIKEIEKYDQEQGKRNRALATNHAIAGNVDEYLKIYESSLS